MLKKTLRKTLRKAIKKKAAKGPYTGPNQFDLLPPEVKQMILRETAGNASAIRTVSQEWQTLMDDLTPKEHKEKEHKDRALRKASFQLQKGKKEPYQEHHIVLMVNSLDEIPTLKPLFLTLPDEASLHTIGKFEIECSNTAGTLDFGGLVDFMIKTSNVLILPTKNIQKFKQHLANVKEHNPNTVVCAMTDVRDQKDVAKLIAEEGLMGTTMTAADVGDVSTAAGQKQFLTKLLSAEIVAKQKQATESKSESTTPTRKI